jgi:hypothetical protein
VEIEQDRSGSRSQRWEKADDDNINTPTTQRKNAENEEEMK